MGQVLNKNFFVFIVCSLIGALIYSGFYFVDPKLNIIAKTLLWSCRIGIPLLSILIFIIIRFIQSGKVSSKVIYVNIVIFLLLLLFSYPIVSYVYENKRLVSIDQYHPYLQLSPQDYIKRMSNGKKTFRIFCIGGSTTEFKDKNNEGWPVRVEKYLNQNTTGIVYEVHNLGKAWYTTQHSLINYTINLRKYHPDMIIVMHMINDLLHNADFSIFSSGGFRSDYRHFLGPLYRVILRKPFLNYIVSLFDSIWFYKGRKVINTDNFPGIESFKKNLSTLIDYARTDGVKVVLMTQPNMFKENISEEEYRTLHMLHNEAVGPDKKWSLETAINGASAYNNAIRGLALREKVPLIDLDKIIPKNLDIFYDDVHYTSEGFNLIASEVYSSLRSEFVQNPVSVK